MNRWRCIAIAFFSVLLLSSCSGESESSNANFPKNTADALKIIDKAISDKSHHLNQHLAYIDSLKLHIASIDNNDTLAKYKTYDAIILAYEHLNLDSLVKYSKLAATYAKRMGNPQKSQWYEIKRFHALPLQGYMSESLKKIDTTKIDDIYPENRFEYLKQAWTVSLAVLSIYSPGTINDTYMERVFLVNRQLLNILPSDHPMYPVVKSMELFSEGDTTLALSTVISSMEKNDFNNPYYDDMARVVAIYEYARGNWEQWLYMMSLLSIHQLQNLILDEESLLQLCSGMVRINDIERAHRYMLEAQVNSAYSGASMRSIHIFDYIPLISKNYLKSERSREYMLVGMIVLLALMLLGCVIVFVLHQRNRRDLLSMHSALEDANERKEDNLGNFIMLCTSYMERLEDFNSIVVRKLGAGQVNELHSLAKSGKYVDEQRRMFYEVFDTAFVNMYPTFVEEVNKLCLPDKQIKVSEKEILTPELRILAFMRLGSDEGAKVARLLGLSLNTIYTYRNRAKKRAINRDTFESDIMKIGRVGTSYFMRWALSKG
ncbi:MAG: DUF6377 domain-containing protein [Muribaculaceae bacterium]|nr:DUF6377 domain-containing protein [Muribaculaceae bacterium]